MVEELQNLQLTLMGSKFIKCRGRSLGSVSEAEKLLEYVLETHEDLIIYPTDTCTLADLNLGLIDVTYVLECVRETKAIDLSAHIARDPIQLEDILFKENNTSNVSEVNTHINEPESGSSWWERTLHVGEPDTTGAHGNHWDNDDLDLLGCSKPRLSGLALIFASVQCLINLTFEEGIRGQGEDFNVIRDISRRLGCESCSIPPPMQHVGYKIISNSPKIAAACSDIISCTMHICHSSPDQFESPSSFLLFIKVHCAIVLDALDELSYMCNAIELNPHNPDRTISHELQKATKFVRLSRAAVRRLAIQGFEDFDEDEFKEASTSLHEVTARSIGSFQAILKGPNANVYKMKHTWNCLFVENSLEICTGGACPSSPKSSFNFGCRIYIVLLRGALLHYDNFVGSYILSSTYAQACALVRRTLPGKFLPAEMHDVLVSWVLFNAFYEETKRRKYFSLLFLRGSLNHLRRHMEARENADMYACASFMIRRICEFLEERTRKLLENSFVEFNLASSVDAFDVDGDRNYVLDERDVLLCDDDGDDKMDISVRVSSVFLQNLDLFLIANRFLSGNKTFIEEDEIQSLMRASAINSYKYSIGVGTAGRIDCSLFMKLILDSKRLSRCLELRLGHGAHILPIEEYYFLFVEDVCVYISELRASTIDSDALVCLGEINLTIQRIHKVCADSDRISAMFAKFSDSFVTLALTWISIQMKKIDDVVESSLQQEDWDENPAISCVELLRISKELMCTYDLLCVSKAHQNVISAFYISLGNIFSNYLSRITDICKNIFDGGGEFRRAPLLTRFKDYSQPGKMAKFFGAQRSDVNEINRRKLDNVSHIVENESIEDGSIEAQRIISRACKIFGTCNFLTIGADDIMSQSGNDHASTGEFLFSFSADALLKTRDCVFMRAAISSICDKLISTIVSTLYFPDARSRTATEIFLPRVKNCLFVCQKHLGGDSVTRDAMLRNICLISLAVWTFSILDGGGFFLPGDVGILMQDYSTFRDMFVARGLGLSASEFEFMSRRCLSLFRLMELPSHSLMRMCMEAKSDSSHHYPVLCVRDYIYFLFCPLPGMSDTSANVIWRKELNTDENVLLRILCHRADRTASKFLKDKYSIQKRDDSGLVAQEEELQ